MSSLTTLARPYARAAFEVAHGQGCLGDWAELLQAASVAVEEPAMSEYLASPEFQSGTAVALVLEAIGKPGDERFERYLGALAENERLALLPEATRLYSELRQAAESRLEVRVVSAAELADDQVQRMSEALAKRFDKDVTLHRQVNPELLGGAVIYAGDEVIDGSVLGRLKRLQGTLA